MEPDRAPQNVWCELEPIGDGVRGARLLERPTGTRLVSAVWELDPGGSSGPYHVHHATEELMLVLDGTPTLRSPGGERTLETGDVVHFAIGARGAHQVLNRSAKTVRYLMVAAHTGTDVIEYVDEGRVVAYSHRESALAPDGLFVTHELRNAEESARRHDRS
jgi:uncharacterized cupin superfamily protein